MINFFEGGILSFIGPSISPPIEIQFLELKLVKLRTESRDHLPVDCIVALILRIDQEIEIPQYHPRSSMKITYFPKLLHELELVCVRPWAIDTGNPPLWDPIRLYQGRDSIHGYVWV